MANANVFSAEQVADILMQSITTDQEMEDDPTLADSDGSSSSESTDINIEGGNSNTDDDMTLSTLSENDGNPMVSSDSNTSSDEDREPTPLIPTRGRARVRGGRGTRGSSFTSRGRGTVRTRGSRRGCSSFRGQTQLSHQTSDNPRPILEALASGGLVLQTPVSGETLGPDGDGLQNAIPVVNGGQLPQNGVNVERVWTDVPVDPPIFDFRETSGLNVETGDDSPGSFYDLFLTESLVNTMVAETNRYAQSEINKQRPLRRTSRYHDWKDTNAVEMRQFIAVLLHMGPVTLPSIEHYWSTSPLYKSVFFRGVTGRDRFQLLLRFWHFADNEAPADDRIYKVRPVLECFNSVMDTIYYPNRDLAIDESMVLWRGRLMFRQYIKNKRHKYGIKLYELCESRGLVLRIRIYSGIPLDDPNHLGQSAATVLDLLDGFLDKGHVVYTDNYYNSVQLFKFMSDRSTYICGTLRGDRRGNPKEVVNMKLKKGEYIWRGSDGIVVCKWKDKRDVLTISNMHQVQMVDVRNRNGKIMIKPNIIRDYNNGMSGVDRSDQMLSYYSALRKTIRWYKKIGLHFLEIALLNAHILYNDRNFKKMNLLEFREAIVLYLLGPTVSGELKIKAKRGGVIEPNEFHYLAPIPPTEKKQRPTKPCRVCTQKKVKRESRYFCAECKEKPALCIDECFYHYHHPTNTQN